MYVTSWLVDFLCEQWSRNAAKGVMTYHYYTLEPSNNRHSGNRFLVLCKEVVPFSEVGVDSTSELTPRPHHVWLASSPVWVRGAPTPMLRAAQTMTVPCYWSSSRVARVAPRSAGMGNTAHQWRSCIWLYERAIVGLSILGGYFIYGCNHYRVRQCPLYRVERLSSSRTLAIHAKYQLVLFILSVLWRLSVSRRVC